MTDKSIESIEKSLAAKGFKIFRELTKEESEIAEKLTRDSQAIDDTLDFALRHHTEQKASINKQFNDFYKPFHEEVAKAKNSRARTLQLVLAASRGTAFMAID